MPEAQQALPPPGYNIFVMDKTGTLTKGVFGVRKIVPAEGSTEEEVLETAAYAESFSNRQKRSKPYHHRGIISGKLGNKMLRFRFFASCVFHQIQYFRHCRFSESLRYLNLQYAGKIYTAADDILLPQGLFL